MDRVSEVSRGIAAVTARTLAVRRGATVAAALTVRRIATVAGIAAALGTQGVKMGVGRHFDGSGF